MRGCCRALLPPTSGAYKEIWVDGAPWSEGQGSDEPQDPLYGDRYLPRKFKIGLAVPEDNTIDVLTNDLGIVALWEDGRARRLQFLSRRRPRRDPQQARDLSADGDGGVLCRAARPGRGGEGGGAAAPRLGRPRQPASRAAQIRHRRARRGMGARAAVGGSRQDAGAVPADGKIPGAGPSRLARAGRRQALSRHPDLERPHRRRWALADAHRAARDCRRVRRRPDPDAEPGHHPLARSTRPTATRSRRSCASTACGWSRIWCRPSAGRWPARRCRPAAWR